MKHILTNQFRAVSVIVATVVALLTTWVLLPTSAKSADQPKPDESIEITAENGIEWQRSEGTIRAFQNVQIVHGTTTVTSDRAILSYSENDEGISITTVDAIGNVQMSSNGLRLNGATATYTVVDGSLSAQGEPAVLFRPSGSNGEGFVLRGKQIVYRDDEVVATQEAHSTYDGWNVDAATIHIILDATQQPLQMLAQGSTRIVTDRSKISAEQADYNVTTGMVKLDGNVVISQDGSTLSGPRGWLNTATDVGRLEGSIKATILP